MITNTDLQSVNLSTTKKDFYQIWNELMDTATKLSGRWFPNSTNESDPGIVLLKVLSGIADKLNYNIDKAVLEAFLPSATQEEAMRKLCEALGYNVKYYQSATTKVTISLQSTEDYPIDSATVVPIPIFSNIKDSDSEINYVTTAAIELDLTNSTKTVECIEGSIQDCTSGDSTLITIDALDDNQRYYLPETQVAENGIFISSYSESSTMVWDEWTKVDNLNTQTNESKVWKFGYDSSQDLPYIQFPEDISTIIEDGLNIKYIRTSGVNGNVAAKILVALEAPSDWEDDDTLSALSVDDNFVISNASAATDGSNIESIDDAYVNFKKTVGTFDTLVTCRDYANKIYQLTQSANSNANLVSNVIVSDIRDDINDAYTLCTFNEYGIVYQSQAISKTTNSVWYLPASISTFPQSEVACDINFTSNNSSFSSISINIDTKEGTGIITYGSTVVYSYNETAKKQQWDNTAHQVILFTEELPTKLQTALTTMGATQITTATTDKIDHFDLKIYPFKRISGLNTKNEYVNSFKYDDTYYEDIVADLDDSKVISHSFVKPSASDSIDISDVLCIKNYLGLTAKITTTAKVNSAEEAAILANIYTSIYKTFNLRKLDFGEEIPFDDILECIENADERIKNVSLEEPELTTKVAVLNSNKQTVEYYVGGSDVSIDEYYEGGSDTDKTNAKYLYDKLALRNVLAGKIGVFNKDTEFSTSLTETTYPSWTESADKNDTKSYSAFYPDGYKVDESNYRNYLVKMIPKFTLSTSLSSSGYTLLDNEVIKFKAPNFMTSTTYSAYVNYFFKKNDTSTASIPATMITIYESLYNATSEKAAGTSNSWATMYESLANSFENVTDVLTVISGITADNFSEKQSTYGALFVSGASSSDKITIATTFISGRTYYVLTLADTNFARIFKFLQKSTVNGTALSGIYKQLSANTNRNEGYLIDNNLNKYSLLEAFSSAMSITNCYVQDAILESSETHTKDGLGVDADISYVSADTEYQLKDGEYLLINYTDSNDIIQNITYTTGEIIRPNFDLADSVTVNTQLKTSWAKTSGFDFKSEGYEPAGMYSLSSSEQIEMRKFVEVEFKDTLAYFYWTLNDTSLTDFPFDETTNMYTLQDNEYFYYTDANKSDIAYYGSGTVIKRSDKTLVLTKNQTESDPSAEDILENGLAASIPWTTVNFANATSLSLTIREYQYITLTVDNILNSISLAKNETELNSDWVSVQEATYTIDSTTSELSSFNVVDPWTSKAVCWQARTKYEINMGPDTVQTLGSHDSIELYFKTAISDGSSFLGETLTNKNNTALSIKSNYLCQYSTDYVITTTYKTTSTSSTEIDNFRIKLFKKSDIVLYNSGTSTSTVTISENNFGDEWTKIKLSDGTPRITLDTKGELKTNYSTYINLNIPANYLGLMMIYYNNTTTYSDSTLTDLPDAFLRPEAVSGHQNFKLKIFNYHSNASIVDSWWADKEGTSNTYELRNGLNQIVIESGTPGVYIYSDIGAKITESGTSSTPTGTLIIGALQIVPSSSSGSYIEPQLNPVLNYMDRTTNKSNDTTDEDTKQVRLTQQLKDDISLWDLDNNFYYTCPIENSIALDINADNDEYLSDAVAYYDYNNVNNKFVVSEIDASLLASGISIAKSSKA